VKRRLKRAKSEELVNGVRLSGFDNKTLRVISVLRCKIATNIDHSMSSSKGLFAK